MFDSSLKEASRNFALYCYALDRASFPGDIERTWASLTSSSKMPAEWPTRYLDDPRLQERLWAFAVETPGAFFLSTVIEATTLRSSSGRGRTIPHGLTARIVDLARSAKDPEAKVRATFALAYVGSGQLEQSGKTLYQQLMDEALAGDPTKVEYVFAMSAGLRRDGDAQSLMELFNRASFPQVRVELSNLLFFVASPESPDELVSFLSQEAARSRDHETRDSMTDALGKTGDRAFPTLVQLYREPANDLHYRALVLRAVDRTLELPADRTAWVLGEAQSCLGRLVSSASSGEARAVRRAKDLTDIIVARGGKAHYEWLIEVSRSVPTGTRFAEALADAISTFDKRLESK